MAVEKVIVNEALEDPLDHGVLKVAGRLEGCDLGCESLPNAKMFGQPGYIFSRTYQPAGHACNGALSGDGGGSNMEIDAVGKVETPFGRRSNVCLRIPRIVIKEIGAS